MLSPMLVQLRLESIQCMATVHDHPYLGITIDDKLNRNAHVDQTSSKASRSLNFVRRNLKNCPTATRELAYNTYVCPQLEYATSIWNPQAARNINSLEKVNRCGVRFVKGDYHKRSSPSTMMKQRKWNTLHDHRCVNDLCQMHKVSHDKFNVSFDHILSPMPQRTHSNHQVYVNNFQPTCNAMQNAFFPRTLPPGTSYPLHSSTSATPKPFAKK